VGRGVRVEVFALGDFESIWGLEMITSHDVVDVVDATGSHSDLGEIDGPGASVGVLGLVLREVGVVNMVVDVSVWVGVYLDRQSCTCHVRPTPGSRTACSGGERGGW